MEHENSNNDAKPQLFGIVERIAHPNFKSPVAYNDIALIKINGSVSFNRNVRPACLPQPEELVMDRVIKSGWSSGFFGLPKYQLEKTVLKMVPHGECNATIAGFNRRSLPHGIVNDTQICTDSYTQEKDTCYVSLIYSSQMLINFKIFSCLKGIKFWWANSSLSSEIAMYVHFGGAGFVQQAMWKLWRSRNLHMYFYLLGLDRKYCLVKRGGCYVATM